MKLLHLVRRRDGVSRQEFGAHWRDPVASAITSSRLVRDHVSGCVQNLTYTSEHRFSPTTHRFIDEWDAIDEYWVPDDSLTADGGWQRELAKVQEPVAERGRSVWLRAREVVLTGHDFVGEAVKVFIFIAPKPGITQQRFFEHWTNIHGPLWKVVRAGKDYEPTRRSVQNYLPREWNSDIDAFGWYGLTEGWHRSLESMGLPFQSVEHDEIIVPDANKFTDRSKVCDALVREHRVV